MQEILKKMRKPGKALTREEMRDIYKDEDKVLNLLISMNEASLLFEIISITGEVKEEHLKQIKKLIPLLRAGGKFFESLYRSPEIFADIREKKLKEMDAEIEKDIREMEKKAAG